MGNASCSSHSIFNPSHQTSPLDTKGTLPFLDKISAVWSSLKNACIVTTKFSQLKSKWHFPEVNENVVCFSDCQREKYLPLLKSPLPWAYVPLSWRSEAENLTSYCCGAALLARPAVPAHISWASNLVFNCSSFLTFMLCFSLHSNHPKGEGQLWWWE